MKILNEVWFIYQSKFQNNVLSFVSENANSISLKHKAFLYENFSFKDNKLFYNDKELDSLPQIAFVRYYDFKLNKFLEEQGVEVINNPESMRLCRDKYLTHKKLEEFGVIQPKFLLYKNQSFEELTKLLGLPFVIKDNLGQKGSNVFLVSNENEFKAYSEKITNSILCQEFIKLSTGKDVRFYVVGNNAWSIVRENDNDFRSNMAKGSNSKPFNSTKQQKSQAIKIAKILGLDVCSVDFLIENNNLIFCESNAVAGYLGFLEQNIPIHQFINEYFKEKLEKENLLS